MMSLQFTRLYILVLSLCSIAVANTEIVNFSASSSYDVDFTSTDIKWPILHHAQPETQLNISAAPLGTSLDILCEKSSSESSNYSSSRHMCPHESWIALDLTDKNWESYSKFTLRISWPASFPSDFSIRIYDPEALSLHISGNIPPRSSDTQRLTRRKYARIRAVDIGVRTPVNGSIPTPTPQNVPFIVILEPLYFTILPASVAPVLLFLVPVLLIAGLAVPRVNDYLQTLSRQARLEIAESNGKRRD